MAITLAAVLVDSTTPRPVQITLAGTASGQAYTVTGTAADGSSWPIPGGSGVSTGAQVILTDTRAPMNLALTYQAVVDGTTYTAAAVTVAYTATDMLVQSLDGQIVCAPEVVEAGDFSREPVVNSAQFSIPGRARPVLRVAPGGDGGGALSLLLSAAQSANMRALLAAGGLVAFRSGKQIRDLERTFLALIIKSPSSSVGTRGTWRVWSLAYTLVDDPQPSTPLSAFTWDDFDRAMSTRTWADFDALFASQTWDQFDRTDWSLL